MTVTAPPEALSEPARNFLAGPAPAADRGGARGGGRRPHVRDGRPRQRRGDRGTSLAGSEDVDRAVQAARAAFEGPWAELPAPERARLINALADLVEANASELAELESLDNGKPVEATRAASTSRSPSPTSAISPAGRRRSRARRSRSGAPNMLCYTRPEPVGVCGQIIPWNFPLLMAAGRSRPRSRRAARPCSSPPSRRR